MTLVVSAPGKVLIAGGYLVLDPKYTGVVVSTSSRFYTVIRDNGKDSVVTVRSPQFPGAEWETKVIVNDEGQVLLQNIDEAKALAKNKFVNLAVQKVLTLVVEVKGASFLSSNLEQGLDITIVGDNDFYSQRAYLKAHNLPPTIASLNSIPPFVPTGWVKLSDVHKTGLGSSASLITSLVTALLLHFTIISPDALIPGGNKEKSLAHNVSQFVHCLAQGKVGSGFDVSSAIFGSHIYKRFDPAVIAPLMEKDSNIPLLPVLSPSNKEWNHEIQPFRLPPGLRLMLGDVDAGSDTPSLVGKVLKWRRESAERGELNTPIAYYYFRLKAVAENLWTELSARNQGLANILTQLLSLHVRQVEEYDSALSKAAAATYPNWVSLAGNDTEREVLEKLSETRKVSEEIREYMRMMGSAADVPIEPPEQTRLLDACLRNSGVICGGVPGAGGYDAIWLLVLETQSSTDQSPIDSLQELWSTWTELSVSPLTAVESRGGGVRLEQLDVVPGLEAVLN
ncbi:hypothetical protein M422DRAFT_257232 [Sphaerobolus stellatus SS14]|uniref:Phosphomevalonate kinase n=1 Tax=Sphaerobolus stellatus (strain SS14) TaxID=990650 RepID=A0A0C9UYJ0_SPHS4|nr:hypothetical protein M422DRAFT_257232 [Sphaerobolus stellatus SS14]